MQALWAHRHLLSLRPCLWLWAPPLGWDVLSKGSRKRSGCGFRFWVCHSHPGQFWTLGFCEAHFLNPKMGMKMQTQWCRVGSQGGLYVKEPGVPGQGGRAGPPPPQQTAASCWQVALHCTAPWMFPLFRRRWFSFSPKSCPELAGCECWGWCGESCSPFQPGCMQCRHVCSCVCVSEFLPHSLLSSYQFRVVKLFCLEPSGLVGFSRDCPHGSLGPFFVVSGGKQPFALCRENWQKLRMW